MSKFSRAPDFLKYLGDGRWELTEDFEYYLESDPSKVYVFIKGSVTDGATLPKWARKLLAPWGRYSKAVLVHDHLYQDKLVSRKVADREFLHAMMVEGIPAWKRNTMFAVVRVLGWIWY